MVEPEKAICRQKKPVTKDMYGSHLRKMLRRGRSIKEESTIGYLELGHKGEMVRKGILSDYYLV